MKRLIKIICLITVSLIMAVPTVGVADPLTVDGVSAGDYVDLYGYNTTGYNGYGAGIMNYWVTTSTQTSGGGVSQIPANAVSISTFCIQDNVDLSANTWYKVAAISNNVESSTSITGVGGTGQLKSVVGYLYSLYEEGDFGSMSASQQADFQNLLWYAQGEAGDSPAYTGFLTSTPETLWYQDYLAYNGPEYGNTYGTDVLNLVGADNDAVQNQLVWSDPPPVPEPSTFLMVGAGLLGIWLLRKFIVSNSH